MVTQEQLTLSLPQVIDLALNSPEIGAVNFNLLHSLLHIMVQQLHMTNTNVEFRGKDGEKIKILLEAAKGFSTSSVQLAEFKITTDDKGKKTRTEVSAAESSKASRVTKGDDKHETVVLIQAEQTKTPQLTICLSEAIINNMQDDITDLKTTMAELKELPKNCNFMEALKGKDKPFIEMFQLMSLAKRIDASECGLHKLASVVEDLTGEIQFAQLNADALYDEDYDETPVDSPVQTPAPPKEGSSHQTSPKGDTQKTVPQKGKPAKVKKPQGGDQGKATVSATNEVKATDGDKHHEVGSLIEQQEGTKVQQTQAQASPTQAHAQASPTQAHAQASPTQAHAQASPTQAHAQASPTQAHAQASPTQAHAQASPTQAHAQASPTQATPTQMHSQGTPTKVAQQNANAPAAEEEKPGRQSVTTEGGRRPTKRPVPELVIKIGNSEKRLQAIEDTLQAYGIPAPVVPLIKYPTRVELPPIDINIKFPCGHEGTCQQTLSVSAVSPQASSPSSPMKITIAATASPPPGVGGGKKDKDSRREEESLARLPTSDAVVALQKDINKVKRDIKRLKNNMAGGGRKDTDDSGTPSKQDRKKSKKSIAIEEYSNLEMKVRDSAETIVSIDQNFNNQVLGLQNQFSILEMEVNGILQKLTSALPGGDSGVESIGDLFKKMQGMQIDVESIAETTASLVDDMAARKNNFESLNEMVELLKTIKADKEDVEDALADKADKCAINRKVSHDQFDTACDELSRGIEEALEKLTTQELLWQQALDEIQFEISNKLDKMELGPLRDFINNKLRMLQERMKSLTALKKEQEAAGTKSKFLRNVNCISCDKDVIMRKQMDTSLMPQPRALPPNRSMAPYLAYELDALRKQQKTLANSRNLNHFESAISGGKSGRMDDHVCNRYCGGSHTVTTPQQRVTRMGHFLAQWGPGAVPATDTVPVKEQPKQEQKETKRSSLTDQGASGDQRKGSIPKSAAPAQHETEKQGSKSSKGSIRTGSAPNLSGSAAKVSEGFKAPIGPGGDEKASTGSPEKAQTSTGSVKGSQGSAKRGSKGSVPGSLKESATGSLKGSATGSLKGSATGSLKGSATGSLKVSATGSLKGSKQGTPQGSKEAMSATEKPEEIPEETPSEVAAAEATQSNEPSDVVADSQSQQQGEETHETIDEAQEPSAVKEVTPSQSKEE